MHVDGLPPSSWICRDQAERSRFLDLNRRLSRVNTKMLLVVAVLVLIALPFAPERLGLVPAVAGGLVFGAVDRNAERFQRPELWLYAAVLLSQATVVLTATLVSGALTASMALLCWSVAGTAAAFPDHASRLATALAAGMVVAAALETDAIAADPLSLAILLAALLCVHAAATVGRGSDIEHRRASVLDPLTGMLNRAALATRTYEIEQQSHVTGEPVAVIVLDLDHFKRVNDTLGHARGDAVLAEIAYRLRKRLRAYDLVYRIGGEEFCVVLAGSGVREATATAESLRGAVAGTPVAGVGVTLSAGVAATAPGGEFVWTELFARADAALFAAKAAGRDRVTVAAGEHPAPAPA